MKKYSEKLRDFKKNLKQYEKYFSGGYVYNDIFGKFTSGFDEWVYQDKKGNIKLKIDLRTKKAKQQLKDKNSNLRKLLNTADKYIKPVKEKFNIDGKITTNVINKIEHEYRMKNEFNDALDKLYDKYLESEIKEMFPELYKDGKRNLSKDTYNDIIEESKNV